MGKKSIRDKISDVNAELEAISEMCYIMSSTFLEDDIVRFPAATIGGAFFVIQSYLDRIGETLVEVEDELMKAEHSR